MAKDNALSRKSPSIGGGSSIEGIVQPIFGFGDDGGGDGPLQPLFDIFNVLNDALSTELGGAFWSALSANEQQKALDRALATLDETTRNAATALLRTTGVDFGGPTRQVRSDITDPASRAWIQERIDSGAAVNEDWYETLTEEVPAPFPTAIEVAFEAMRRGEELGAELFDPDAAATRFREAFGDVVGGFEALPGQVGAANERVNALFGDLTSQFRAGAADITGGFENILGTATELVSGLGESERQDINRRFTEAGNVAQMSLIERGLGGTGITSSVSAGVERERSTALLSLEEQIAQQQLGVQETFGLAGLSAQERLLAGGINLGGAQAGAMQFGNQLSAQTSLASLSALGNIAGAEAGAFGDAATQRFNAWLVSMGFPIETQLAAGQQALQLFSDIQIPFQQPNTQPIIQATVRGG